MGSSSSKKQVHRNDNLVQQHDDLVPQNINHNYEDNNNTTANETVDLLSRIDRQYIETIKNDLRDTPELFVLNNMIMCVMFFEDYKKCEEELLKTKLENPKDFIAPHTIFDRVTENVIYHPHHGPKKHESEPLIPKRYFVFQQDVKVIGTTQEIVNDNDKTVVRIEESRRKGFVRLKELNRITQNSGSPILRLESAESQSRSSTDSTDTAYNTLFDLKTPKPIDIVKGLEQKSNLPKTCISLRKIKKVTWDPDELRGEQITEDDLYETVSYINSKSFMKYIQDNPFEVVSKTDLNVKHICNSRIIQEKIHCHLVDGESSIPCEIIPAIKSRWPLEQTLKFLMKGERHPEHRKRYIYPTVNMVKEIETLDCVLLPKCHLYKQFSSNDSDIEWELCFPHAQKYLETFMSLAQMKSLLIMLTLHKTYIEPKTKDMGLNADHIRNFILMECESNFSEWPEHRLGIKLMTVIKHLNSNLSKPRPIIPDFFVTDKNILSQVPTTQLRQAQKALDEILQAPVMYFMRALRNLRYTKGRTSFFPPLDFRKLHDLLLKSGLEFSNPQLVERNKKRQMYSDSEMMVLHFKDAKKRQAIINKRKADEEKKSKANNEDERRGSVDSIDVNWQCEKKFDLHKKRALLKFFIDTFLDIAEKGLEISSKKQTLFYIKQAYYLTIILQEQCPAFEDEVQEILEKISHMELQCEQKDLTTPKYPIFNKNTTESDNKKKVRPNGIRDIKIGQNGTPRKSVTFVDVS